MNYLVNYLSFCFTFVMLLNHEFYVILVSKLIALIG